MRLIPKARNQSDDFRMRQLGDHGHRSRTSTFSVCIEANLIGFGSINACKSDFRGSDYERVTIHNARDPRNRFRSMRRSDKREQQNGRPVNG